MATNVAFLNATFFTAKSTTLAIAPSNAPSSSARVTDPSRACIANRAALCTVRVDATDVTLFPTNRRDDTCPPTLPELDAACTAPAAAAATAMELTTTAIAAALPTIIFFGNEK